LRDLRPLGAGEVLDRAITLFVRHFWRIMLVCTVALVPIWIDLYYAGIGRGLNEWFDRSILPPGERTRAVRVIVELPGGAARSVLGQAVAYVCMIFGLLGYTACAIAVGRLYTDPSAISLRSAYGRAMYRWFPQLLVSGLFVALIFVALFFVIVVSGIALLILRSTVYPTDVNMIVGSIAIGGTALVSAPILFMWLLASTAIAIESVGPWRAFVRSFKRVLRGTAVWRSLGAALVLTAFGSCFVIVEIIALTTAALLHRHALASLVEGVGMLLLTMLTTCYVVVYVYDLRIRTEGYDLLIAAQGGSAERL
jgi:hypothetical protein